MQKDRQPAPLVGSADAPPRTPGWVKAFGLVGVAVVVVVIVLLVAGGNHGPGRHVSSSDGPSESPTTTGSPTAGSEATPADGVESPRAPSSASGRR